MSGPHPDGRPADMLGCCILFLIMLFGVAVGAVLL